MKKVCRYIVAAPAITFFRYFPRHVKVYLSIDFFVSYIQLVEQSSETHWILLDI